jgi:hypothetical protein
MTLAMAIYRQRRRQPPDAEYDPEQDLEQTAWPAGYPAPGVGSSAIIAGQKAIVGGIRHVDSFPQKIPAPVFGENAAGIKREHAAV